MQEEEIPEMINKVFKELGIGEDVEKSHNHTGTKIKASKISTTTKGPPNHC
jgi:hypothetical protein